jgi:hypothetical protein
VVGLLSVHFEGRLVGGGGVGCAASRSVQFILWSLSEEW